MISDKYAPTGMNWFNLSLISDSDESEISVNFVSVENPIEITNFWLEHGVWSEIIEQIKESELVIGSYPEIFEPVYFFSFWNNWKLENLKYGHIAQIRTLISIFLFNN